MSLWGLLARAASRDPAHTTRRFGLFTFFSKTAQSAGILILGWSLAQFDYHYETGEFILTLIMAGAPLAGACLLFGLSLWLVAGKAPYRTAGGIGALVRKTAPDKPG